MNAAFPVSLPLPLGVEPCAEEVETVWEGVNSRRKMILGGQRSSLRCAYIASRSGVRLARSAFNRLLSSSNSSVKGGQYTRTWRI